MAAFGSEGLALALATRSDSPASQLLDPHRSPATDHQLTTGIANPTIDELLSESGLEIEADTKDEEKTEKGSFPLEAVPGSNTQSNHHCLGTNFDLEPGIANDEDQPDAGSEDKSTGLSVEPAATTPKMDFDELLTLTGEFGRFQAIVFAVLSLGILIEVMLVLGYVFIAATPPHWCTAPQELDRMNLTHENLLRLTLPVDVATETGYSQCHMYDRNYTGWTIDDVNRWLNVSSDVSENWTTTTCQLGWDYDHSVYASTIVTDVRIAMSSPVQEHLY